MLDHRGTGEEDRAPRDRGKESQGTNSSESGGAGADVTKGAVHDIGARFTPRWTVSAGEVS